MFDPSKARHTLLTLRALHAADPQRLDAALTGEMANCMVALRQQRSSGVSARDLAGCGFSTDELQRLGSAATDEAARIWHGQNLLEAAA